MIVMMICHYDETNPRGGLEKQARLLSRLLRSAGEDIVVLGSTRRWCHAGVSDDNGVRVRLFWTFASPQISGRYLPAALIWAFQLLVWIMWHRGQISILHGHQIRIHAFVAAIARKVFGIPTILKSATGGEGADIRTIGSRKYFGPKGRAFVIRNTDCFVATTKSIKDDLLSYGAPEERIRLIPNGVRLPTITSHAPPEQRARRALYLGRIDSDKNTVALAKAATAIAHEDGLQVHFYGTGEEREKLEEIIKSANNPAIVYHGVMEDPEHELSAFGYLLLPSNAEGLSNAMVEAMANGVVPVTTRVSGCVDHIIPGSTGFFFEGTGQADLRRGLEAIGKIRPEKWQFLSSNVADYARERFDIGKIVDAYKALYIELAKRMDE